MWTPKKLFTDDINIMERATTENKHCGKFIYKIEIINNCRMYLGIIFLSEIVNTSGRILRKYIYGTDTQQKTKYNYPTMRKPPSAAWGVWKEFICRNFVTGAYIVSPPLQYTMARQANHYPSEIETLTNIPSDITLINMINTLPQALKKILGKITIMQETCEHLLNMAVENKLIAASDGSMHKTETGFYGGHGYSTQATENDNERIIGSAATPRSNDSSSLTSEMYGILANLLIICLLEKKYRQTKAKKAKYMIICDNKEALKRAQSTPDPMNISETLVSEYDLWKLISEIRQTIKGNLTFRWVKGHQNEKNGKLKYGPFDRNTSLNIEMDKEASKGVLQHQTTKIMRDIYSTTIYGIYDTDNIMVGNMTKYLYTKVNGTQLEQYMKTKFNWSENTLRKIDWTSLEKTLNKYKPFQRTKICQLMYNWQNVGQQKSLYGEDKGKCPTGCGEDETYMHYLNCKHPEMSTYKKKRIQIFKQQLIQQKTYTGITIILTKILRDGIGSVKTETFVFTKMDKLINKAIEEQQNLGSTSLEKGFVSNKWKKVQQEWAKSDSIQHNEHWGSKLIVYLHEYTYLLWKKRNEYIHGNTQKENRELRKGTLKKRIKELYQLDRSHLHFQDKKHFNLPIQYRLKKGMDNMAAWIKLTETIFEKNKDKNQSLITNWLTPRDGNLENTEERGNLNSNTPNN